MFTDKNLLLSNTRAVTTGGIDTASCINIGASRDLWDGTPLRVAFSPVTGRLAARRSTSRSSLRSSPSRSS